MPTKQLENIEAKQQEIMQAISNGDECKIEQIIRLYPELLTMHISELRNEYIITLTSGLISAKKVVSGAAAVVWGIASLGTFISNPLAFTIIDLVIVNTIITMPIGAIGVAGNNSLAEYQFNREQWTLLHFAAAVNQFTSAKKLINMGINESSKDQAGRTFLDIARSIGNQDFVKSSKEFIDGRKSRQAEINAAKEHAEQKTKEALAAFARAKAAQEKVSTLESEVRDTRDVVKRTQQHLAEARQDTASARKAHEAMMQHVINNGLFANGQAALLASELTEEHKKQGIN